MDLEIQIKRYFGRLNQWRHLPDYQLERRIDALLSLYLPGLIESKYFSSVKKKSVHVETIIPEFPVRALRPEEEKPPPLAALDSLRIARVDYFLVGRDDDGKSHLVFLELKTDRGSAKREPQLQLMRRLNNSQWTIREILQDVLEMAARSTERQKYAHLIKLLESSGLLEVPEEFWEYVWPVVRRGYKRELRRIAVHHYDSEPERHSLYVAPERVKGAVHTLTFDDFISFLTDGSEGDALVFHLMEALKNWKTKAGSRVN